MCETCQHGVFQGVQLVFERGIDAWVGVAKQIYPPRTDGIEVAAVVMVIQPRPLSTLDGHQGHGFVVLHLCAGVPHTLQAALNQLRGKGVLHVRHIIPALTCQDALGFVAIFNAYFEKK
jgi:hypothetical protein